MRPLLDVPGEARAKKLAITSLSLKISIVSAKVFCCNPRARQ
jgi:hypothetical protein